MRQLLTIKSIFMNYCVALRPLIGCNYVKKETDASEREIKGSLEFLYPGGVFLFFLYESWFEMS